MFALELFLESDVAREAYFPPGPGLEPQFVLCVNRREEE
jgi:hypothetical protein